MFKKLSELKVYLQCNLCPYIILISNACQLFHFAYSLGQVWISGIYWKVMESGAKLEISLIFNFLGCWIKKEYRK